MTQATVEEASSSFPLPDVFSSELTALFQRVQPAIVQVRTEQRGGGTGIIWDRSGRIITNYHVVGSAEAKVQVQLFDGRTLDTRVLHVNPQLDLALLEVQADGLHALQAGDSSALRVGEWVFAIGHPWGQRWALTAGVVSTINTARVAKDVTTQFIKSDVRLAPGNSGGPLLNAEGDVVGVNAMIFGGDLSVAIPSNVVSSWIAHLPRGRALLGVEIQQVELPASIREQLQGKHRFGLLVVTTQARPSYLTDVLVGDIVLEVAGTPISDAAALRQSVAQHGGSDTLPVKLLRGGKIVDTTIAIVHTA